MTPIAMILLLCTIALPIAWFVSEFKSPRWLRHLLGTMAIALSFGVAFLVGSLERLNSNAWFGSATKDLIDTTVAELDAGRNENVVRALRQLRAKYEPTYENRAQYDTLVRDAINEMKATPATRPAT